MLIASEGGVWRPLSLLQSANSRKRLGNLDRLVVGGR